MLLKWVVAHCDLHNSLFEPPFPVTSVVTKDRRYGTVVMEYKWWVRFPRSLNTWLQGCEIEHEYMMQVLTMVTSWLCTTCACELETIASLFSDCCRQIFVIENNNVYSKNMSWHIITNLISCVAFGVAVFSTYARFKLFTPRSYVSFIISLDWTCHLRVVYYTTQSVFRLYGVEW
jgi:hypothetical protein